MVPTHGRTGLKHVFLGGTAERIVQHSPCPVFVVRQPKRKWKTTRVFRADTILVPVDFSDCALEGLKYAIEFADSVAAKLILFHVVQLGYAYTADGFAMYDLSVLIGDARRAAKHQMGDFVRRVKVGGVKFETVFTDGLPMPEIRAFAEARDVDLIITATHGLAGLKHVLIGSIAEQVVRHAPCSVLVVPSRPQIRLATLPKPGGRKGRQMISRPEQLRTASGSAALSQRDLKLTAHAFPERRKTNKFRESHVRS